MEELDRQPLRTGNLGSLATHWIVVRVDTIVTTVRMRCCRIGGFLFSVGNSPERIEEQVGNGGNILTIVVRDATSAKTSRIERS